MTGDSLRPSGIAQLVRSLREAGRAVVVVPAGVDKAQTLTLFADILDFPDYFGRNLDALEECLRAYAAGRDRATTLIWDGAGGLRTGDPRTYAAVVDILDEVAAGARMLDVTVRAT